MTRAGADAWVMRINRKDGYQLLTTGLPLAVDAHLRSTPTDCKASLAARGLLGGPPFVRCAMNRESAGELFFSHGYSQRVAGKGNETILTRTRIKDITGKC